MIGNIDQEHRTPPEVPQQRTAEQRACRRPGCKPMALHTPIEASPAVSLKRRAGGPRWRVINVAPATLASAR